MFKSNFKFNGTDSFKELFSSLGIDAFTGISGVHIDEKGNSVFNVAGFKKDEISVHYVGDTIEIICKGNSPYFGTTYTVSADIPSNGKPTIKYADGCVIVTPQRKPNSTELQFDEEPLLD